MVNLHGAYVYGTFQLLLDWQVW